MSCVVLTRDEREEGCHRPCHVFLYRHGLRYKPRFNYDVKIKCGLQSGHRHFLTLNFKCYLRFLFKYNPDILTEPAHVSAREKSSAAAALPPAVLSHFQVYQGFNDSSKIKHAGLPPH